MSEFPRCVSVNCEAKSRFWYVSFIGPDGKQRRRSTKVPAAGGMFKGERLSAKQAKNRAMIEGMRLAQCACESVVAGPGVSVRRFLDDYAERRRPYVSRATLLNMRGAFKRLCGFLGRRADLPMRLLSREDAKRFMEFRRLEVRALSVKKDLTCICAAFNDAFDSELVARNPFARLHVEPDVAGEKLVHEAFTLDEVRFMVTHFPDEWSSAVRCCFETYGQRLGDVVSLRWGQFDFEERVVRMRAGKTGRVLAQPMRDEFFEWARGVFEARGARNEDLLHPGLYRLGARASSEFSALLRAFRIGVVSQPMGGKRRQVGSKSFHSVRATCATLIQMSGVAQGVAMRLVGHDSDAVHSGYVRPDVALLREAANAMPCLGV